MNGVGKKCDRTRYRHDHHLRDRRGEQSHQAQLHRTDPGGTGLQRAVDTVGGIVAVRDEQLADGRAETAEPAGAAVVVRMVMVVAVVAVVAVVLVRHTRRPPC